MKQYYDAIYRRKSIRKYSQTPLSNDTMKSVRAAVATVEPLDYHIRFEIQIKDAEAFKSPVKAPHALCFYSEEKDNYLLNAGYIMQQLVLALTTMELGTCWVGRAKPNELSLHGMQFVIMVLFGESEELLHRESVSEFKRKNFDDFTDIKGHGGILGLVRLAPSAANSQPWLFTDYHGKMVIARSKRNPVKTLLLDRFNQIDMGIAMCHLQIGAEKLGQRAVFSYEECPVPRNSTFVASAEFDWINKRKDIGNG